MKLGLRTKLKTTMAIIRATLTLHNIALEFKDDIPPPNDDDDVDLHVPVPNYIGNNNNFAARTHIINTYL